MISVDEQYLDRVVRHLLILRYHLAESVPRIPYAAILSAAHVAKMLDPLGADTVSSPDFRMSARQSLLVPESRFTSHTRGYAGRKLGIAQIYLCDFGNYLARFFGRYFALVGPRVAGARIAECPNPNQKSQERARLKKYRSWLGLKTWNKGCYWCAKLWD
jgi:hypothetical protein